MITIESKMKHYKGKIDVSVALCGDGTTALVFTVPNTHEPLAKASVNVPGHSPTDPTYIFIKDYSENKGVEQTLLDAKVVELTGFTVNNAWVTVNGANIINGRLIKDIEDLHSF